MLYEKGRKLNIYREQGKMSSLWPTWSVFEYEPFWSGLVWSGLSTVYCRNMFGYFGMFEDIETFRDILRHVWTFWVVLGRLKTFVEVMRHFCRFVDVLGHFWMFWDVLSLLLSLFIPSWSSNDRYLVDNLFCQPHLYIPSLLGFSSELSV